MRLVLLILGLTSLTCGLPFNSEICQEKLQIGTCQEVLNRYFYNATTNACEPFFYTGCDGNGNNFEDKDECQKCLKQGIVPYDDTASLVYQQGVGNLLLVIDSKNDAIEELATFKEDFGGWTADNMETIKLKKEEMPQEKPVDNDGSTGQEMPQGKPVDNDGSTGQGGGEDDTGNEDNAEQNTDDGSTSDESSEKSSEGGDKQEKDTDSESDSTETNESEGDGDNKEVDEGKEVPEKPNEPIAVPTTEEIKFAAVPKYSYVLAHSNGTLTRQIEITSDSFFEISISLRVVGYNADLRNSTKNENPFFGIELVKTGEPKPDNPEQPEPRKMEIGENEEENETEKEKKEENEKPETETENEKPEAEKEQPEKEEEKEKKLNVGERILGLDIRNYGRVFERNSQWLQIRYNVPNGDMYLGQYDLRLTSRRGNTENSNIYIANLKFKKSQVLTAELAKVMDEAAAKGPQSPGGNNGTDTGSNGSGPLIGNMENYKTVQTVLIVIIVILALALIFISVKYWSLKREIVGKYSVSVTPNPNRNNSAGSELPAYENPLYSGGDGRRVD